MCSTLRLIPHSAIFVHIAFLPTHEGFIYFDFSTFVAAHFGAKVRLLQAKTQTVEHEPCRLLGYANGAVNLVGGNAVLAVGQHPKRGKPLVEADRGILKDGAQFYGELAATLFALPALLALEVIVVFLLAGGTGYTVRPAHGGHSVYADLLI